VEIFNWTVFPGLGGGRGRKGVSKKFAGFARNSGAKGRLSGSLVQEMMLNRNLEMKSKSYGVNLRRWSSTKVKVNSKDSILQTILQNHNLIRSQSTVVELGAAPGGWTRLLAQEIKLDRTVNWSIKSRGNRQSIKSSFNQTFDDLFSEYDEGLKSRNSASESSTSSSSDDDQSAYTIGIFSNKGSATNEMFDFKRSEFVASTFGLLLAVDEQPMDSIPGVKFVQGNIFKEKTRKQIEKRLDGRKADVIFSDLTPELTSGDESVYQANLVELSRRALEVAEGFLRRDGSFVVQVPDVGRKEILESLSMAFTDVELVLKPAVAEKLKTQYVVASGFVEFSMRLDLAALTEESKAFANELCEELSSSASKWAKRRRDSGVLQRRREESLRRQMMFLDPLVGQNKD